MGDKRSYKSYSQEFKKEAVALVLNQGFSALEATRFLGIAYQYALSMEAENWRSTIGESLVRR